MRLSDKQIRAWTDVVSQHPGNAKQLAEWLSGPFKAFYPFEGLILAYGELIAGEIKVTHLVASGHEPEYLSQLQTTFDLKTRGSLRTWFKTQEPLLIDASNPTEIVSSFEMEEMRLFRFRNVVGHGVLNARMNAGTYFGFVNVSEPFNGSHKELMQLIAPYLNYIFLHCIAHQRSSLDGLLEMLSPRRQEIIRLLATGLPDKGIARNLNMSEKTVRNQLSAIYARIGVHKRAELIALLTSI